MLRCSMVKMLPKEDSFILLAGAVFASMWISCGRVKKSMTRVASVGWSFVTLFQMNNDCKQLLQDSMGKGLSIWSLQEETLWS